MSDYEKLANPALGIPFELPRYYDPGLGFVSEKQPSAEFCSFDFPVRRFFTERDASEHNGWSPRRQVDETQPTRIAAFVTVGSLRGWNTCGDGPDCSPVN